MTNTERKRIHRLLAAIKEGLTDAPKDVLREVAPQLEQLAKDWNLSEIIERCDVCWKRWHEEDCDIGETPCECPPVNEYAHLSKSDIRALKATLESLSDEDDDDAAEFLEEICSQLTIETRLAGYIVHTLRRDMSDAGSARR